jgi:hypothetical protein
MKQLSVLFSFLCLMLSSAFAQYDEDYVETYSTNLGGETYSVVKMSRRDEKVKVKYFAAKDYNGKSVYQRYLDWSRNKKIVAYSSGTYMTACDASYAKPDGLCIDNGQLVNNEIKNFDGLAIVYATGGMVVSNLKDGDLSVTNGDGTKMTLNLNNSFDRTRFIKWAGENSATVFQTHLFYYKNSPRVFSNGSSEPRERRFLAVGRNDEGELCHYIVNLGGANTVYSATMKVAKFLQSNDGLNITFLINLDTGCQNVFGVNASNGSVDQRKGFSGTTPITNAANLIVYYYE